MTKRRHDASIGADEVARPRGRTLSAAASIALAPRAALLGAAVALLVGGCGDDGMDADPPMGDAGPDDGDADPPQDAGTDARSLQLAFEGLPQLGDGYVYEGWIIVDGAPVSTGRFSVDGDGAPNPGRFELGASEADAASAFVLTIEPDPEDDPAPSAVHPLAGAIEEDGSAELSVDHPAALGTDFADATGEYVLNTPSSGDVMDDYDQGIWWLVPGDTLSPGLSLPELPEGWRYEGWVVGPEGPLSTGTFRSVEGEDDDGAGSTAGPDGYPPFPGQDYIDPPEVLTDGYMAVISVEPDPDDSPAPFVLKPLADMDIGDLEPPATQMMTNIAAMTRPTGTATLE